MAYLVLEDFAAGIDLRRDMLTAPPGTLRTLTNAFVNAGGEIEKRKTLTGIGTLPTGTTHGLAASGAGLVVFGTVSPGAVGTLPDEVTYQELDEAGDGETIDKIIDVESFGTSLYVVALFTDGEYRHFLDGTRIDPLDVAGTNVRAHKSKMYSCDERNLRFSAVLDAADWTTAAGNGIIDLNSQDTGDVNLVGMEEYYGSLALFARNQVQIWIMDADPVQNNKQQTLGNIGLIGPHAAARYGNGDVLFLSDTGIRSLRARNSSNAAVLSDLGSPVDALVKTLRDTLTPEAAQEIRAIVDPLSGHFWLVWGTQIIVLAQYLNSKITAWSTFQLATAPEYVVVAGSRIAMRQGEELVVYGGVASGTNPFDFNVPVNQGTPHGSEVVEVVTPFLDLDKPATTKKWDGIDIAAIGTWEVQVNPDPNREDEWLTVARITRSTFYEERIPLDMESTHIALRLLSSGSGEAKLMSLAVHAEGGDEG
jgi:hypothetical protein